MMRWVNKKCFKKYLD